MKYILVDSNDIVIDVLAQSEIDSIEITDEEALIFRDVQSPRAYIYKNGKFSVNTEYYTDKELKEKEKKDKLALVETQEVDRLWQYLADNGVIVLPQDIADRIAQRNGN